MSQQPAAVTLKRTGEGGHGTLEGCCLCNSICRVHGCQSAHLAQTLYLAHKAEERIA